MIQLRVGGVIHEGWKSFNVKLTMQTICGEFLCQVTDKWGDGATTLELKPFDSCEIWLDNTRLISGYVYTITPTYNKDSHTITIAGKDRAGDLDACSVANNNGQWIGLKLEEIVQRICAPFNIAVKSQIDTGATIPQFNVEQGSTAFAMIQKLCAARQCMAISDGNGGLLITRAGATRATSALVEGVNILEASANYDVTERFSSYIVKGQSAGDEDSPAEVNTGASATVADENVPRYRPLVIVADGDATTQDCITRARGEATLRRGKCRSYMVSVVGWTQQNGQLWQVNQLVQLQSPHLGVNDLLLICDLNFVQDVSGQRTEFTIMPADAYTIIQDDSILKADGDSGENPYITG